MARHANPMEAQRLRGADKKDPQRYRKEVPKSDVALGNPPDEMECERAQKCWFEISAYTIPGVMTGADRIALEMASHLLAEFREDPRKIASAKRAQLIGILARFGMTPSDRTKLGVDKTKQENPFANLDD